MERISLTAVLLSLTLVAACAPAATPTITPVPDIDIHVALEPDPPTVGESTLIVTLTAHGEPVDGAAVAAHGSMDHEGMAPVNGEASESTDGVYRVPFAWTMGGGWVVTITATLPDNRGSAEDTFEFFVEAVSGGSVIHMPGTEAITPEATSS